MQIFNTRVILGRLRALREEKELRQGYIARRLGIDRTTYLRKELGLIPITTKEWLMLAVAMNEDPCYFFRIPPEHADPARIAELALIELYRSLSRKEKKEIISGIRLILKGIRRKLVREALERLTAV